MEETAGEGRRGAISGEICCSKGEIVGEDGIVFVVVGEDRESEKREMNVMSVKNIDEAIFLVCCNDEQIKALLSFSLLIRVRLICVAMILSL